MVSWWHAPEGEPDVAHAASYLREVLAFRRCRLADMPARGTGTQDEKFRIFS
jgi:hypothetical protein